VYINIIKGVKLICELCGKTAYYQCLGCKITYYWYILKEFININNEEIFRMVNKFFFNITYYIHLKYSNIFLLLLLLLFSFLVQKNTKR